MIDYGHKFKAFRIANDDFKMKVKLEKNKDLNPLSLQSFRQAFRPSRSILSERLQQALEDLNLPFFYDLSDLNQGDITVVTLNNPTKVRGKLVPNEFELYCIKNSIKINEDII